MGEHQCASEDLRYRDPVAEYVESLAEIPAGPKLARALAELSGFHPWDFSDRDTVLVLEARFRQDCHVRGQLLSTIADLMSFERPGELWPSPHAKWEVSAALGLTGVAASRLCDLAFDLRWRLPKVLAAMKEGRLDEARARVFSDYTSPLTDEQSARVVDSLLDRAPEWTTAQLEAQIRRIAIALDPQWSRKRYERATRQRKVMAWTNPDGTANIGAYNQPLDQVAIACAVLDAIGHAGKAAGMQTRIDHIRSKVHMGLLTGRFRFHTDSEIIDALIAEELAEQAGKPAESAQQDGDGTNDDDPGPDDPGPDDPGPDDPGPDGGGPDDPSPDDAGPGDSGLDRAGRDDAGPDGRGPGDAERSGGPDRSTTDQPGADEGYSRGTAAGGNAGPASSAALLARARRGPGRRGGLRLWVGLETLLGGNGHASELMGWGPVHAELARHIALSSACSWWCVITDEYEQPISIFPVRSRPNPAVKPGPGSGWGEIWIQTTTAQLANLPIPIEPGWAKVLAEITRKAATTPPGPPDGDPTARLPGPALRRWLAVRDRRCIFPTCRVPAFQGQADHTREHARGGPTTYANLGCACSTHHRLREHGWHLRAIRLGWFVWTSPCGMVYQRRPEPGILHNQPKPCPGPIWDDDFLGDSRWDPDPDHCFQPPPAGPTDGPATPPAAAPVEPVAATDSGPPGVSQEPETEHDPDDYGCDCRLCREAGEHIPF